MDQAWAQPLVQLTQEGIITGFLLLTVRGFRRHARWGGAALGGRGLGCAISLLHARINPAASRMVTGIG